MPGMTQAGYRPPEPKKAKAPEPKKKKKKKSRKKRGGMNGAAIVSLVIFAVAALIGAGTIFLYVQTQPYLQTFVPGTMVMGYPLAGASRESAEALLDTIEEETVDAWQLEIICQNQTYTLTAKDVALAIDREATLDPLWAAGREGGMLSRYLQMMKLWREPLVMQPVLTYDMAAVDAMLEAVRADVACSPVDATVRFTPGSAEPFAFTDEETGYRIDLSGVREGVEADIRSLTPGSLTIEPQAIEPGVYRAELENAITMRSRITVELVGDPAGVGNAARAIGALNGARAEAGETLSFNALVGRRTEENGYVAAAEPAYGADVSGVGGGVCQASTLLYRAALLGGMEIAERSAAVRPVAYCGMGQEAAVSDQGLDLILRNQTDMPLFVLARTYTDDGKTFAELTLIGEPLSRRYALESLSEETGRIEEPVYVRDREGRYAVYDDERVPVGEALTGYAAGVERVTLDKDGQEIAREVISENVYEAVPPMIYVGVMQREK